MTGTVNLLEKLPHASDQSSAREKRVATYIMVSVVIASLTACFSTAGLVQIIGPDDYLALVVYACFGFIVALPITGIIFATLVSFKLSVRLAALSAVLALFLAALAIGTGVSSGTGTLDQTVPLLAPLLPALPIVVWGLAIPLVLARHLLGWHIVFSNLHESPNRQRVTVAGLLVMTSIVAICLAFLRICPEPGLVMTISAALTGLGFIILLPVVFWLSRAKRYWFLFGFGTVAALPIGCIISYFFQGFYRSAGDWWESLGWGVSTVAGLSLIGLALIACRLAGGKLFVSTDPQVTDPLTRVASSQQTSD